MFPACWFKYAVRAVRKWREAAFEGFNVEEGNECSWFVGGHGWWVVSAQGAMKRTPMKPRLWEVPRWMSLRLAARRITILSRPRPRSAWALVSAAHGGDLHPGHRIRALRRCDCTLDTGFVHPEGEFAP